MRESLYIPLRDKIAAIVPEIMELKFGCKVLIEGGYTPSGEHVVYHQHDEVYEAANVGHTEIMTNDTTSFTRYKKADYATLKEILGRDIMLADCLRAIGRSGHHFRNMSISETDLIFEDIRTGEMVYLALALPLHEQSDEVGEWLLTVIK